MAALQRGRRVGERGDLGLLIRGPLRRTETDSWIESEFYERNYDLEN